MTRPLDPILAPRSIAVIGASRSPNTIGHQVLANLLEHGYTGTVYPVNPTAPAVHSMKAWPDVEASLRAWCAHAAQGTTARLQRDVLRGARFVRGVVRDRPDRRHSELWAPREGP